MELIDDDCAVARGTGYVADGGGSRQNVMPPGACSRFDAEPAIRQKNKIPEKLESFLVSAFGTLSFDRMLHARSGTVVSANMRN
jgi:hypothetical protein